MKPLLFTLIICISFQCAVAQEKAIDRVATSFCSKVESLSLAKMDKEAVLAVTAELSSSLMEEAANDIEESKNDIRAMLPKANATQVDNIYQIMLSKLMIEGCPSFIELSRKMLPPSPPSSPRFEDLTQRMDQAIIDNQDKPLLDQYNIADAVMTEVAAEVLEEAYEKDDTENLGQQADAMGLYLFHHSKHYIKVKMSLQYIQQLDRFYQELK